MLVQAKLTRELMLSLRNYTCADETMETSTPIKSYTKILQNKKYVVDVLLDASHSKIWVVDDFISPGDFIIWLILSTVTFLSSLFILLSSNFLVNYIVYSQYVKEFVPIYVKYP